MTNQNSIPEYVTKDILKEEISASEKRLTATLDSKIESTSRSLKDYTDSRFTQLDGKIADVDIKVKGLDAKLTKYFELMMQTITSANKELQKILFNHEERITALEAKRE